MGYHRCFDAAGPPSGWAFVHPEQRAELHTPEDRGKIVGSKAYRLTR